ncbi:STAS domain-containing protein [Gluconobacter wancherniae]|uniref:STAS domain-containing protein n=1 Tax=Gluconobacter wancherniae TaxID=1307955 RepID=UPI001B8C7D4E|nr:STAS domain-containing protein [Gluconobacter wancherniae]MBS1062413.1 STAS domain-containing protein [Gluconobacter wancherniae]
MNIFILPPELNSEYASILLNEIRNNSDDIVIDAQNVKKIGGLCLQILISARKSGINILNPSKNFLDEAVLLGAEKILLEQQ